MVYEWKLPGIYNVDAQQAGEELERIKETNGCLTASGIVDASRIEEAILHSCFEWQDDVAAEKYREVQAQGIIRCLVIVPESTEHAEPKRLTLRAFYAVDKDKTYESTTTILKDDDKRDKLIAIAMNEAKAFRWKYRTLERLNPIFDAIDSLVKEEDDG